MARVTHISIENFKIFGRTINIPLTNPTVLIGPNNAGKTSILQAFALWSIGIKTWITQKGNSKARIRYGVPINRYNLHQLPVQNARFLWNNCEVRKGSTTPIPVTITLGIEIDNVIYECPLVFTQRDAELIYCKPSGNFIEDKLVMDVITNLQINLLYSMSGIATEEVRQQPERVNYLMGQGMTSEVLRNLCINISEESPEIWDIIVKWMKKLFDMHLQKPEFNLAKGVIDLAYKHHNNKKTLDIASAGRGALQILLLLAYMYSHRNSIILVDEPDAHLEIIKQHTVYALLNDVASQNNIQLIIATHSEVVLNDAVDNSIAMILDGEAKIISDKSQEVRPVLKDYGVEHFFKASITKNILYIEGSTDILILKAFAKRLDRQKSIDILEGELNYYYIQNPCFENDIENEVARNEGYYRSQFAGHFSAIKRVIPEFEGIGIVDSDANGNKKNAKYPDGLTVYHWGRYEIENYFIFINVLDAFFKDYLGGDEDLFYQMYLRAKEQVVTKFLFDGDDDVYRTFKESADDARALIWKSITQNKKMSKFVDMLMDEYVELAKSSYPLRKGEYYKLVQYMDIQQIDPEIISVLELIETKLG